jgi:hypothetical protein
MSCERKVSQQPLKGEDVAIRPRPAPTTLILTQVDKGRKIGSPYMLHAVIGYKNKPPYILPIKRDEVRPRALFVCSTASKFIVKVEPKSWTVPKTVHIILDKANKVDQWKKTLIYTISPSLAHYALAMQSTKLVDNLVLDRVLRTACDNSVPYSIQIGCRSITLRSLLRELLPQNVSQH